MTHTYQQWTWQFAKDWESRLYALWTYHGCVAEIEKQASYIGLIRLCLYEAAAVVSTSSADPVLTKLLSDFKRKFPMDVRDPILMMLKETPTHRMMQVHHLKGLPYGNLTSTDTTDNVRIGSHFVRKLYDDLHVNRLEDVEYFSTSKLVNVGKYPGNPWMY